MVQISGASFLSRGFVFPVLERMRCITRYCWHCQPLKMPSVTGHDFTFTITYWHRFCHASMLEEGEAQLQGGGAWLHLQFDTPRRMGSHVGMLEDDTQLQHGSLRYQRRNSYPVATCNERC